MQVGKGKSEVGGADTLAVMNVAWILRYATRELGPHREIDGTLASVGSYKPVLDQ